MSQHLRADEEARLLDFLRRALPTWKRKTLEQRLSSGRVRVNEVRVSRPDARITVGDEIVILSAEEDAGPAVPARRTGIEILHQDELLVAIDKPAGLLAVSSERQKTRTALALVRQALSRPGKTSPLWPVHRIDRETSGVLLFARSRAARAALQAAWSSARKEYLAIVEGRPEPPSGVIEQALFEDANLAVHVGDRPGAKPARTRYETQRTLGRRALLDIALDTGRRHQIRAHLAWLGCPVVGDPRYGTPAARMGLHALRLVVPHPADGRELVLEAPPPRAFLELLSE